MINLHLKKEQMKLRFLMIKHLVKKLTPSNALKVEAAAVAAAGGYSEEEEEPATL